MMQIYFWAAGLGSLFYFWMMRRFTGRWTSTFAGFWLLCGIAHLACGLCWNVLLDGLKVFIQVGLAAVWLLFLIIEMQILYTAGKKPENGAAYLIVLGAQVRGTRITDSLMRRLDAAYEYLQMNPETIVVVSGGQGKGEAISEADAMAENLIQRGIRPERIIREDRSTSTEENLRFSAEKLRQGRRPARKSCGAYSERIVLVTNQFHLYRALLLGRKIGYTDLSGLAATTNPVLLLNYLAREFFAVLLTKVKSML